MAGRAGAEYANGPGNGKLVRDLLSGLLLVGLVAAVTTIIGLRERVGQIEANRYTAMDGMRHEQMHAEQAGRSERLEQAIAHLSDVAASCAEVPAHSAAIVHLERRMDRHHP